MLLDMHSFGLGWYMMLASSTAAEEAMYPGETIAIDLEPSIEELLELGLTRLETKPTWKLWEWQLEGKEFLDADSFR